MRSLWTVLIMLASAVVGTVPVTAQPVQEAGPAMATHHVSACVPESNVDRCWRSGVQAEKLGNAEAALAAYESSCTAGLQLGGCYEAGKIYFLNAQLRDYGRSRVKMVPVCESDDIGIAPYACKYLGIIYQKGLAVEREPERAFSYLAKSCFPAGEPFIDGSGCEILGNHVLATDALGDRSAGWLPDYIAYLAFTMGCSDGMKTQCNQAKAMYRQAVAQSAIWLARCAEDAGAVALERRCLDMVSLASAEDYEARQTFRRQMIRMFHRATEYAG